MFEQSFVTSARTKRDRTIALALLLQAAGVAGVVLLPLANLQPMEAGKRFMILPLPPLTRERPQPMARQTPASTAVRPRFTQLGPNIPRATAPGRIGIAPLSDAPVLDTEGGPIGPGSGPAGNFGDFISAVEPAVRPGPKPERRPLRVSSTLSQSQLVFGPKPSYPRLAVTARIEGTVRLQATISREGRIENLHVLTGHPLLIGPAMEAVRQWRYRPVLLNGDPVEAITEIDVNFTLHP